MILKFQIDDVTDKDADDIAAQIVLDFQEQGVMITEYWVEEE
jgi:hypothetical protein